MCGFAKDMNESGVCIGGILGRASKTILGLLIDRANRVEGRLSRKLFLLRKEMIQNDDV